MGIKKREENDFLCRSVFAKRLDKKEKRSIVHNRFRETEE